MLQTLIMRKDTLLEAVDHEPLQIQMILRALDAGLVSQSRSVCIFTLEVIYKVLLIFAF